MHFIAIPYLGPTVQDPPAVPTRDCRCGVEGPPKINRRNNFNRIVGGVKISPVSIFNQLYIYHKCWALK